MKYLHSMSCVKNSIAQPSPWSLLIIFIMFWTFVSIPVFSQNIEYSLQLNDLNVSPGLPWVLYHEYISANVNETIVDEYIVMELYDSYYFYPSWAESLDYITYTITNGERFGETIMEFMWPESTSMNLTGVYFYGALFQSGTYDLISLDTIAWGCNDALDVFRLTSTAFNNGQPIPDYYSCDGADISPALYWGNSPSGTQSHALIMSDPDAPGGDFTHWILFDIPASVDRIPENIVIGAELPNGGKQGKNGFNDTGYGGPCPPSGTHHYYLHFYALDIILDLPAGSIKSDVTTAMEGHILAQSDLTGIFTKH